MSRDTIDGYIEELEKIEKGISPPPSVILEVSSTSCLEGRNFTIIVLNDASGDQLFKDDKVNRLVFIHFESRGTYFELKDTIYKTPEKAGVANQLTWLT